jgi:hypothetical protein
MIIMMIEKVPPLEIHIPGIHTKVPPVKIPATQWIGQQVTVNGIGGETHP